MAFTLVNSDKKGWGANGGTTNTISLTGVDLIIVLASFFGGSPIGSDLTDVPGNTFHALTRAHATPGNNGQLFYAWNASGSGSYNLTTGSGFNGLFPGIMLAGFSGSQTSSDPFDVEATFAVSSAGTTVQAGSVTPSVASSLIISGLAGLGTTQSPNPSINLSYSIVDYLSWVNNINLGCSLAYLTTSSASNPTWTDTTSDWITASSAVFKPGAGGTSSKRPKGPNVTNPEFHSSFREKLRKPSMQEIMYYNQRKAA